jgi:DsbC/DsbD-like thiol-disulfide interchange protein
MGGEGAGVVMRGVWLIAFALLFSRTAANAVESAPAVSERATVSLVSEADSYRPGQDVRVGLRFRLAPGWHIYWRNPGDAGSPPEVTWALPAGARAGDIAWPAPVREAQGPVTSYVYSGDVLLPVRITPPSGDGALDIAAAASWLVCGKICVPEEGRFRLSLPAGAATPGAAARLFADADARAPRPGPFAASVAADGSLRLAGQGLSPSTIQGAWFYPFAWGEIDQNTPQPLTVDQGGLTLRLKPGAAFKADQPLDGVVVLRAPTGIETYLAVRATQGAPSQHDGGQHDAHTP